MRIAECENEIEKWILKPPSSAKGNVEHGKIVK